MSADAIEAAAAGGEMPRMADRSAIEWTDATWNPIVGCSVVSPGCTHCYAMRLAGGRMKHHPSRAGLTRDTKAGPVWTGEVRLVEEWLGQPLRWRGSKRIFVCAHGDLFAEQVPDAWIDKVFAVMALAPQHTFQVLTKRADRMRRYCSDPTTPGRVWYEAGVGRSTLWALAQRGALWGGEEPWPLAGVWLGVSVEDQARADERIPHLLNTPAAVRYVSAEPLLGPIDLTRYTARCHGARDGECIWPHCPQLRDGEPARSGRHCPIDDWDDVDEGDTPMRLDWIIAGGESGPHARPMHPDWARSLRDQCQVAGSAFFMKQMTKKAPIPDDLFVSPNASGGRG